jgi:S-adenosylhomocysteine hydrolase
MEIFQVLALASGLGKVDFLTLATGDFKTFVLEHMKKVKNNTISDNTCHFKMKLKWICLRTALAASTPFCQGAARAQRPSALTISSTLQGRPRTCFGPSSE